MMTTIVLLGPMNAAVGLACGLSMYVLVLVSTGALREEEYTAVRRLWRNAEAEKALHR
jgi:hypothetical protein